MITVEFNSIRNTATERSVIVILTQLRVMSENLDEAERVLNYNLGRIRQRLHLCKPTDTYKIERAIEGDHQRLEVWHYSINGNRRNLAFVREKEPFTKQ